MKRLKKIINRENIPNSKKLVVFSIFLFVSSFLWFFIALSNNYEDFIDVNYFYKNFPDEKGILGELPINSRIEVETSGYNIFKYKYLINTPKIIIDIDKCSNQKNNTLSFINEKVKSSISKILGSDVKILQSDFIHKTYKLSNLASKKVRIKPNIQTSFAKQYRLSSDIKVQPTEIKVSGYKGLIDTLKAVYTEDVNYTDLNNNLSTKVKIKKVANLRFSVDSVNISVLVEKYTEKRIKIPIKVINKPKSIEVDLFTNEIEVVFNIGLNNYENIDATLFKAVLDYKDMINSSSNLSQVRIVKQPKSIKKLKFSPKEIEFLLEKK